MFNGKAILFVGVPGRITTPGNVIGVAFIFVECVARKFAFCFNASSVFLCLLHLIPEALVCSSCSHSNTFLCRCWKETSLSYGRGCAGETE